MNNLNQDNDQHEEDFLWVTTVTPIVRNKSGITEPQAVKVDVVAKNVNLFIANMHKVLEETPEKVGEFQFTEFTIKAEISATGTISIFGSGVETTGSGGLSFKFERR